MAIDGTYGFVYCGVNGLGVGVFTVTNQRFEGSDYGGIRYSGTAKENPDGTIALEIKFDVPAGAELVQGTAAQDVPHGRQIKAILPPNFGDGRPQEIPSPPGAVTVMVKRVPDAFAPAAMAGFTLEIAKGLATATGVGREG
jgi:hypothetical protein